jgi:hypothetical protein
LASSLVPLALLTVHTDQGLGGAPPRGRAAEHRAGGRIVAPVLGSVAWIAGLTLVFAPLAISRCRRLA